MHPSPLPRGVSCILMVWVRWSIHRVNESTLSMDTVMCWSSFGIQQSPVPTQAPALEPITNSGGGGTNMSITINDYELTIDPECTMDVAQNVMANENCRTILARWLKVYHDYHDTYPLFINATSMSCIYYCRKQPKKATEVLTWHFTSNHRRAKWFRDQGMFDPAVSLKRLEQNWAFSLEEQTKTTTIGRPSALPQYDDEGNLI